MGLRTTPEIPALNYGVISRKLRGRADMDFYDQAVDYLVNYVVTPQGEAQYRGGSIYVANTRDNNVARLIPFIYETSDTYVIEVTEDYMRFYRNHGQVTLTAQAITDITNASPAVVTYSGADTYSNGDRITIYGVVGMHQVNGREFIVANVNTGANTFEITDVDANDIDSTAYDAYASGGYVAELYEISSPYQEEELFEIDYTQAENTLYIVHGDYAPRKLTRSAHTSWTLATFDIVGNPFGTTLTGSPKTITGITKADPAVVTSASHGYSNGDIVKITGVTGMTEVNKKIFTARNVATNTFELEDYDSLDNTAYLSGGVVDKFTAFSYPSLVTQIGGRIIYGASSAHPTRLWFSKILFDGTLDDFTLGDEDADALILNIRGEQVNKLLWLSAAESYLSVGTSGGAFMVKGGSDTGITPTSFDIRPVSFNGASPARPVNLDNYNIFAQRNGTTIRSFEYDALHDGYTTPDRTLLADDVCASGVKEFSYTTGTPNIVWGVLKNGKMVGLTFDPSQKVVAWHPHNTNGSFEATVTLPIVDSDDERWQCVARTINGGTKRFIEYAPKNQETPKREDYFTGEDNKETDETSYLAALWNVQKTLLHADAALIFDGRDATTGIDLTVVGSWENGSSVTLLTSASFFTSDMATNSRRIQTPNGGQVEIDTYTSGTEVSGTVLYDLEDGSFTGGDWYYMARSLSGLWHFEGEEIAVLADGGVIESVIVSNGSASLDDDAGYVIAGLGYTGIGKTEDITGGDEIGRGQTKEKSITNIGVRLRASLGTKFGTSLYNMEHPPYLLDDEIAGRPPRLFDGVMKVEIPDERALEKNLYWLHDTPTPSNIQYLQPLIEVDER